MSAAEHESRRPTPAEVVAGVAVAALTRTSAQPEHAVTISRNARGVVQFEVVVRGVDLYSVAGDAIHWFDALAGTYPYPDTNGGETA